MFDVIFRRVRVGTVESLGPERREQNLLPVLEAKTFSGSQPVSTVTMLTEPQDSEQSSGVM